jgi:hypothetical protein
MRRLGLGLRLRRRWGRGVKQQVGRDGVEKLVGGGGRLCRRGVVAAAARRGRGAVAAADAGATGLWGRLVVAVVTRHFSWLA